MDATGRALRQCREARARLESPRMHKITRSECVRTPWGHGCERITRLETPDLSVVELTMPGGAVEARHLHERASQYMTVLEGAARLETGGDITRLEPGDGFLIPPGVAHHVETDGSAMLRLLVVSQPSATNDRREA